MGKFENTKHNSRPTQLRKVPRKINTKPTFSKKFTSILARPFQNSDTLIVAGKLQKLSYGLHIQMGATQESDNLMLDLFLGSYPQPNPNDTDTTHDSTLYHSMHFLTRNEFFFVRITPTPDFFHIDVNGREYLFDRGNGEETARFLKIGGSIAFLTQVHHRAVLPIEWPRWQSSNVVKSENYFLNDFPIPMRDGRVVVITALPYGDSRGNFEICFTQNAHPIPALKIRANFRQEQSVSLMGMNSEQELEEDHLPDEVFPFEINRKFRIAIGFTNDAFLLAVNGNSFPSFQYRSAELPASLNGFYIRTNEGMRVKIISADHTDTGRSSCEGFQKFSEQNYQIE